MVYLAYYVIKDSCNLFIGVESPKVIIEKESVLVVQSNVQGLFIPSKAIDKKIIFPSGSDEVHRIGEGDIESVPSNLLGIFETLQDFIFFVYHFFSLLGLFLKHSCVNIFGRLPVSSS